jgi:hypothetical protein
MLRKLRKQQGSVRPCDYGRGIENVGGCREGRRRAEVDPRLFQGRARPASSRQDAHQGRGAADCGEHRQAAGVGAEGITGGEPGLIGMG